MPTAWPEDVGCVLYETASDVVFIDPLVPAGDGELWRWADERCRDRRVSVLRTIGFHGRSGAAVTARYEALATAPEGVEAHPIAVAEETLFFIPEHRALVPGDTLIATEAGELTMCPPSWLDYLEGRPSPEAVRAALRPLLALDVELVLVSHGPPILAGGHEALARALGGA